MKKRAVLLHLGLSLFLFTPSFGMKGVSPLDSLETPWGDVPRTIKKSASRLSFDLDKNSKEHNFHALLSSLSSFFSKESMELLEQSPPPDFYIEYNKIAGKILKNIEELSGKTDIVLSENGKEGIDAFIQSFIRSYNAAVEQDDTFSISYDKPLHSFLLLHTLYVNGENTELPEHFYKHFFENHKISALNLIKKINEKHNFFMSKFVSAMGIDQLIMEDKIDSPLFQYMLTDAPKHLTRENWLWFFKTTYESIFDPTVIFVEDKLIPSHIFSKKSVKIHHKSTIIANNSGYSNGVLPKHVSEGKPLSFSGDLVDYNIFIPEDHPLKGVLIQVYGGAERQDKSHMTYRPQENEFSKDITDAGYVYITLNLPDLHHLEGGQLEMPEGLFLRIQNCIRDFGNLIKTSPEKLGKTMEQVELLKRFQGLPLHLQGLSYGGRMTMRQFELNDTPFDSFISTSAVLSNRMGAISDRPSVRELFHKERDVFEQDAGLSHLSIPLNYLNTPQGKKNLLIQYLDDNNTNAKGTLEVYKQLKELGENSFLYIIPHGNPIPHSRGPDPDNKGHTPSGKGYLPYRKALFAFMNGKKHDYFTHNREIKGYDYLANRHFREATVSERCLGALMETFFKSEHTSIENVISDWESIYAPVMENLYRAFLHTRLFLIERHMEEELSDFPTLLKDQVKSELKQPDDRMYKNVVKGHVRRFVTYLNEYFPKAIFPSTVTLKDITEEISVAFGEKLHAMVNRIYYRKEHFPFSFEQFHVKNPELLKDKKYIDLYKEIQKNFIEMKIDVNVDSKQRKLEKGLDILKMLSPEQMSENLTKIKNEFLAYIEELTKVV